MSQVMEEEIKRWTARRKSALVLEIIQGKTTVAEASRQFDLTPSEIESWRTASGHNGVHNGVRFTYNRLKDHVAVDEQA
jgi:transposase-like protein